MNTKDCWKKTELNLMKNIYCSRTHSTPSGLENSDDYFSLRYTQGYLNSSPKGFGKTKTTNPEGGECE